jgi:WD40 repeat protein
MRAVEEFAMFRLFTPWVFFACLTFSCAVNADEGKASQAPAARTDLYGDSLPDGAIARLGSVRLRHAGLCDVVFLSDGKTVLSAGSDRVLRFWDMATGLPVRSVRLEGTAGPGQCVTLSPDGKTLVAHDKQNLVFWEVSSGKEIKSLAGPRSGLSYLYFSPNGKTLAVGSWDSQVTMWEWELGKSRQLTLPPRNMGGGNGMPGHFSVDGKWFVAGGGFGEPLCVFEPATGREVHRLDCDAGRVAISPNGKRLAVASMKNDKGGRENLLRLFDLETGKERSQFPLNEQSSPSIAFAVDNKTLACGYWDHSCLVDSATGRTLHRLEGPLREPAFSRDGKTLIGIGGQRLRFWDVATGQEQHNRPGDFGWLPVVAFSPDGRLVAGADAWEQPIGLWDTATGRLIRSLPVKGDQRAVRAVTFSPDGKTLFAGQYRGCLQSWDVASAKEGRTVQLQDTDRANGNYIYYNHVHVSSDGKRAATAEQIYDRGGQTTGLVLWDTITGKPVQKRTLASASRECTWLGDGLAVAVAGNDGLTVVDLITGSTRFHVPGAATSGSLTASPDGRLLAARLRPSGTANADGPAVGIWEAATGKQVTGVASGRVAHVALTPDNRTLVTTDEASLCVWDLATGGERCRWKLPEVSTDAAGRTFVSRLLLAPSGRTAFTALADGTALIWDLTASLRPAEPLVKAPGDDDMASWWLDLAGPEPGPAYAAVWRLAEAPPKTAVSFLRRHLKPAADADFKHVREYIQDLDSDTFAVRDRAYKQLEILGSAALPALREAQAQNPSPEVRRRLEMLLSRGSTVVIAPEVLRRLRAIQVLERIASPDARQLLGELAHGVAYAVETQEAKVALGRLDYRMARP